VGIHLQIHPLPSVDTQVIFRDYQPIDGQEIFDFIVGTAVSMGVPADDCKLLNTSTGEDIRVLCGEYHCLVTQSAPLEDKSHLKTVQDLISVKASFPEAPQIVQAATAYTQISVQKGVIPHEAIPPDLMDAASDLTAFCNSEEAQTALALARAMTRFVVDKRQADAVFWGTSLFLMKPELFLDLDQEETAGLIYLHAHYYGEQDAETGHRLVGVIGAGAQALIGYAVTIRPCALPPDYLVNKIYDFVAFTLEIGRIIQDRDVFGLDENEKIQVLHHLPQNGGAPEIELKVVHNPELGIVRKDVPTIYKHYDDEGNETGETMDGVDPSDLNPNDPVDAAILEQLRKLNKTETVTVTVSVAGVTEEDNEQAFRQLDPPVTPPETEPEPEPPEFSRRTTPPPLPPPANRLSMEELRKFAQQAQTSPEDTASQPRKRGLLDKLFGRKSG